MVDQERGAYTPPTDSSPLAFEARQPVRGARPFPLTLIVSVLVLLGLAAAIFVFYSSGVRQGGSAPQVVGTPVGGLKSAAPPDAQPQDAAQGLEIYRSESGQPPQLVPAQPPQFTPPPEQPQARPQAGPPVVVTPPATAPSATTPALRPAQNPPPVALAAAPAAQTEPKTAPKAAAAAPKSAEGPKPSVAAEKTPAAKTAVKPAPEKPAAQKPAAQKPTPEAPAAAAKASGPAVQIGAVSSEALADKTWNEAVAVAPGLAAGKGKGVEKLERDGKTLYRTSVTGFSSKAAAQAFCDKLKAAGKACFVK
ncbi:MAG TPA: SPOR domain-containing protein [Phenylobacterium sp.]|nr:SPOR domain-containing protein [Phenylobacterium sp.]